MTAIDHRSTDDETIHHARTHDATTHDTTTHDEVPGYSVTDHRHAMSTSSRDRGQATTEYALVMLAAALVALLVVAWATAGGGAGKVGLLFDRILDEVIGRV